jgi:hypothetical protein
LRAYAFRETRSSNTSFQRVRVIEHARRNKWKVEWIEPNPGLVDYVESGQLIVSWKEHKAFLKEEENAEHQRQHNERHGYERDDSPITEAVQQVFESVGDDIDFFKGSVVGSLEAIARLRARAGIAAGAE